MKRASATLFALYLTACASSGASGPHHGEGHQHSEGHGEGHGEGQKHEMAGGMKAFHDVLAPPYHMDKGPARDEKACGNVAGMKDAAARVAAEPVGDAAEWKAKSEALARSVEGLEGACAAPGRAEVSAKLEVVHDGFHALMKARKP